MNEKPTERAEARASILIADDDEGNRTALASLLRQEGYSVDTAVDGHEALRKLQSSAPDVLLTDFRMPGMDGVEVIERGRENDPGLIAILMTAFADITPAIRAMQIGAEDYLVKPLQMEELTVILDRALERRALRREASELRSRLGEKLQVSRIVGAGAAMQAVFRTIDRVAPTRATVLITGESGTGKELVAQAIHDRSPRAKAPFVKLHCAALAESLLESELFGHEKGSFTGAGGRREGHFKSADGGTLFLDEIGEISASTQVKLLRFLQERTFERVGGNETLKVDVRIITATNRDLRKEVDEGRFREDLYYRLNVVNIPMPPLRARRDDILPLARYFLERFARENQKELEGFDRSAIDRIEAYGWPGNVRELENIIERAVVLCEGKRISADDLPLGSRPSARTGIQIPGSTLEDLERQAILTTLDAAGGSTSRAAKMLGISVRKVQYRLQEYGVAMKRVAATKAEASAPRRRRATELAAPESRDPTPVGSCA
jgi:two-component system response regulator HydG